ncbi:PIN-like domain-containing protein [Streptacidiphilus sp. ASG 303]|uniref:PIN-like domain-containing protein n=1 Tax=Streptacidiphilus sp. ASG 303 TaxID=2896847 RepID=UPI001E4C4C5D|nr:PIN-like domain-containing protein [Streptacidiphilus sp. ASG 303]MCD0484999.1 PIN-like domain-containing protein [Streptacidiphilus sp. ASG 303]
MAEPEGDMGEPVLLQRFAAWLQPGPSAEDAERSAFFKDGIIVLDTNVLLSLYEYTETSREEVLSALEQTAGRLWMPYQVGLEFVRGRRSTLESRKKALASAATEVNKKLMAARKAIVEAKDIVCAQLDKYARAQQEITGLDALVADAEVDAHLDVYRHEFKRHLDMLKADHGLALNSTDAEDPILPRIAQLYGEGVGEQPTDDVLRRRLEEATAFRFPNKIPPGFSDVGKDTPLKSAGDFLLWEELIEHVGQLSPSGRRVLFVSNDTKEDWYEQRSGSSSSRPWPSLVDELKRRAQAGLRIETPPHFFGGIREFLDAELAEDTYAEIARVSEAFEAKVPDIPLVVTEESAPHQDPPEGLVVAAASSVGLAASTVRAAVESASPAQRLFQWWLIGVTAQLGRRPPGESEPTVGIAAARRSSEPPSGDWVSGTALSPGEWLHRDSSWIAPWFINLLESVPQTDRAVLRRLAAQQAESNRRSGS